MNTMQNQIFMWVKFYYSIQFLYVLIYLLLLDLSNSERDILHSLNMILLSSSSLCISNRLSFMFRMLSGLVLIVLWEMSLSNKLSFIITQNTLRAFNLRKTFSFPLSPAHLSYLIFSKNDVVLFIIVYLCPFCFFAL